MTDHAPANDLAFELRDGYFYARIADGSVSLETSQEYIGHFVEHCLGLDICKVLVERQKGHPLKNVDAYRLIAELADNVETELKLALVDADPNNRSRLKFGARAARSKRLKIEVFETVSQAEKWLRG